MNGNVCWFLTALILGWSVGVETERRWPPKPVDVRFSVERKDDSPPRRKTQCLLPDCEPLREFHTI